MTTVPKDQATRLEVPKNAAEKASVRERNRRSGFSLVEMLVALGILSSLAAIALYGVANVTSSSKEQKLKADTATLNSAIRIYEGNGGNLAGLRTEKEVLARLKSASSNWKEIAGLRNGMVDSSLDVEYADTRSKGDLRARWDSNASRFVIANSGRGVSEFVINHDLSDADVGMEERTARLKLAKKDTWVWDYKDYSSTATSVNSVGSNPNAEVLPPQSSGRALKLNKPEFSVIGGTYSLSEFPLLVGLTNPNRGIPSDVIYTVGGEWLMYGGQAISIGPDTELTAYVVSRDPEKWLDSTKNAHFYSIVAEAPELGIAFAKPAFNYMELGGDMLPGIYDPVLAEPGALTIRNLNRIPKGSMSAMMVDVIGAEVTVGEYNVSGEGLSLLKLLYIEKGPKKDNGKELKENEMEKYVSDMDELVLGIPVNLSTYKNSNNVDVSAIVRSSASGVLDSNQASARVGKEKIQLRAPNVFEDERPDGLFEFGTHYVVMDLETTLGDMPAGARIYYTVDGSDPGNSPEPTSRTSMLYEEPILAAQPPNIPIRARVYSPEGKHDWFDHSSVSEIVWPPPTEISFAMTVSTSAPPEDTPAFSAASSFFTMLGEIATATTNVK